jgi:hypothetical protein
VPVAVAFRVTGGEVGLSVGPYDLNYPLTIDPIYAWHTFYGASDWDVGYGITTDGSGNVYVTGSSYATWNGPAGQSPLHAHTGYYDIFVLKLDSSGAYQWHTFYGAGSSSWDAGYGIATDGSGNLYVTGASGGAWNGPGGQSPLHAHSGEYSDIFVLKLNSSGSYQWHTFYYIYYYLDNYSLIAKDGSGDLYVIGTSSEAWNGPGGQSPLHAHSGGDPRNSSDIFVMKLDSSGSYQWHTFYGASGYEDACLAIATDGSGNVYVTGSSYATWNGPAGQSPLHAHTGYYDIFVLKLDSSGTYQWHTFYGSSGNDQGLGIVTDGSGNVYVTGNGYSMGDVNNIFVLKLSSNGSEQWLKIYGSNASFNDRDTGYGITIDGRGNVYVTGESDATWNGPGGQSPLHAHSGGEESFVLKLNSSGSYQWHTFYGSSSNDMGLGIVTDGSGNVYVIGTSGGTWNGPAGQSPLHTYSGGMDIFVLKLSDAPISCDFDGDAKTDIAIYRNSMWAIVPSKTGTAYAVNWGGDASDIPIPGDYDGDGKTDVAIYRKSNGVWYIVPSSNPTAPYAVSWGGVSSDIPVPGDYDGDGKTDLAIYRQSTGVWFIKPSSAVAPYAVSWGGDASDIPVPGDYDGDGKTDVAIYRKSNGVWYIVPSSSPTAPYAVSWGGDASDMPVPGDYDGDGKTDIAIYRQSTGVWFIVPSKGTAPYAVSWGGMASDVPVTNNRASY